MPTAPGPTGAGGPTGGAPPNPNPTPGDVGAALSVEQTWLNLMRRIGFLTPEQINDGAHILHGVDVITGLHSR